MEKVYKFKIVNVEEGKVEALIQVDPDHPVYKGHFPSNPVTPGAVQVQMIGEVLKEHLGTDLMLCAARSIKFTAPHLPGKHGDLSLHMQVKQGSAGTYEVNATLSGDEISYLKFRGEFRESK